MTAAATICFLTNSDSVKERQVKAFAANVQAVGMRVSSLAALKTALESHPHAIVVSDHSVAASAQDLQALGKPILLAAYLPDSAFTLKDLPALLAYDVVCFSSDKNPLPSQALRHALAQLRQGDSHLPLTAMLHWGYACLPRQAGDKMQYEIPSNLAKGMKDVTNFSKGLASQDLKAMHFVSDGLLWGHVFERTMNVRPVAKWFDDLKTIFDLASSMRVINFHSDSSYELGVFENLSASLNKKSVDNKKHREFVLINPRRGMKG